MGLWNNIKRFLLEEKEIERTVSALDTDQPHYPTDDFIDNSMGGYGGNEVVYACLNEISSSLAEAPICVLGQDGIKIPEHPLTKLLKRPNPYQSEYDLWETMVLHIYLSGNAFLYKVRNARGEVIELWLLRPDRMAVVPSKENFIAGYVYRVDAEELPIAADDVVHITFPCPHNDYLGMSPIRAALKRIAVDNDLTDTVKVILQNRGIPAGILTTSEVISAGEAQRIKRQWKQNYGGKNKGDLAILDGDAEFQAISYNADELAVPDLTALNESRICMVFGVPPILIGARVGLEHATYANYKEARMSFWEETISALQRRIEAKLAMDKDLNPGQVNEVQFDNTQVAAFEDKRQVAFQNAMTAWQVGVMTRDEAREVIGLDPLDDDDEELMDESDMDIDMEDEDEAEVKSIYKTLEPEEPGCCGSGCCDHKEEKKVKEPAIKNADLNQLRAALGNIQAADEHYDRLEHATRKLLKKMGSQLRTAIDQARMGTKADDIDEPVIGPDELARIQNKLAELEPIWTDLAKDSLGQVMRSLMINAGTQAANQLDVTVDLDDEVINTAIRENNLRLAGSISNTMAKKANSILIKGIDEAQTISQISKNLANEFGGELAKKRSDMIARTEVIRAANEGAKATYKASGVTEMKWLAVGDACPYCQELDGKVVSVDEPFVKSGDHFQPEGASSPLSTTYGDVNTPPAHPNCRCTVVAEFKDI
jgi:HK97 family phage portal protein